MRDYLNRLRMQFQRFMIGRYGMDQFGRFLSSLLLALIIFNFLIPAALPSRILWALEWIVLIILYARMFSKNINKRYQENEAFLRRQFYVSEWWKKWKFRFQESRKYHIYRCPNCKQKVRVPREEDGSASTARNAEPILSKKADKTGNKFFYTGRLRCSRSFSALFPRLFPCTMILIYLNFTKAIPYLAFSYCKTFVYSTM